MKLELRKVLLMFYQYGRVMENLRTPEWGGIWELASLIVSLVEVVTDIHW